MNKTQTPKNTIKVCVHKDCCQKGSQEVYENLRDAFSPEEALVLPVEDCFSFCALGPNVALNDNIVTGVKPFSAVEQIQAELENPSCKADGLGSRSIDELDSVLDTLEEL